MESDLILDGFLAAEKQHGVRYITLLEMRIALSIQHWCRMFRDRDTQLKSKNVQIML